MPPPEKVPAPQQPAPVNGMPETGSEVKTPPAFELKGGDKPKQEKPKAAKYKTKDEIAKEPDLKEDRGSYWYIREKGVIVTLPKDKSGSLPTAIIYGGLIDRGGEKQAVFDQIPPSYFSNRIMVFANHYSGYTAEVKPAVQTICDREGFKPEFTALLGFSKGGERVRLAKGDEAWKVIGLIDPSVWGSEDYPCPAYMVWNTWKEDGTIEGDARYLMHKKLKKDPAKGDSKRRADVGHKKMPAAWFEEWGGKL